MSVESPNPSVSGPSLTSRKRLGVAAIVLAAFASALLMQQPTWAPVSYLLQVEALSSGHATIDDNHWQSGDVSWIGGHYFSNKAPGMPFLLVPEYLVLKAAGVPEESPKVFRSLAKARQPVWFLTPQGWQFAYSKKFGLEQSEIRAGRTPLLWALGLIGTVLPALLLMLLVRLLADRLEPGTGTLTALSLGLATLVLPFTSQLFGHMWSSLALLTAFWLALIERGRDQDLRYVAAVGLVLAGAVTIEYPTALGGLVIGAWVLLRRTSTGVFDIRQLATRTSVLVGAGLVGLIPLLLFNKWAFGSPLTISYHNEVTIPGRTGHDTFDLLGQGFWGIGVPRLSAFLELFLSPRGLLIATPVMALTAVGVVGLWRRGFRGETGVIAVICGLFIVYVAGCWWPIGGLVPGPRYLIPVLPFAALGLAYTWKRLPSTTLVLSLAGMVVMLFATLTHPLVNGMAVSNWWTWFEKRRFSVTALEAFLGVPPSIAVLIVVLLFAVAIVLGAVATERLYFRRDLFIALGALAVWAFGSLVVAPHVGETVNKKVLQVSGLPVEIVLSALATAVIGLALALGFRSRRPAGVDS